MKWKDSGEIVDAEGDKKEEYFDEEHYSPWAERKEPAKGLRVGKIQMLPVMLGVALLALVAALLVLLTNNGSDATDSKQISALAQRLQKLEERLDRYEGIDEKVTTIWEQAKSFEKFKDRFDRSEASTSLRMDHLTMSLEALQKQLNQARAQEVAATPSTGGPSKTPFKIQYYQVQAGDTFYSISKKYDLKVEQLLKMNRLKPDSVIVPGQKLVIHEASQ